MSKKILNTIVTMGVLSTLLVLFMFFVNVSIVQSASTKFFGVKITDSEKATPIKNLENSGYKCFPPGRTIEATPLEGSPAGTPTSYLIPWGLKSRIGSRGQNGEQMAGHYELAKTQITCVNKKYPYDTQTVSLDTVTFQWQVPRI